MVAECLMEKAQHTRLILKGRAILPPFLKNASRFILKIDNHNTLVGVEDLALVVSAVNTRPQSSHLPFQKQVETL
jgi:hypothetical protein